MAGLPGGQGVCARFHQAVELIGARWSGAIIQVLLRGRIRYADLRAAVPQISDRMLCERLRELEAARIVDRHVSAEPPVRVEYELTPKGRALGPALDAIASWAERWSESKNEERKTKHEERNEGRRTQNRTSGTKEQGTGERDARGHRRPAAASRPRSG